MDDQLFLQRDLWQKQEGTNYLFFYVILYCIVRTISFYLDQSHCLYAVLLGPTVLFHLINHSHLFNLKNNGRTKN